MSLQPACMRVAPLLPCSGVFPFFLCDLMQLAFIKSHLGAFDSKVPVSPLRNLSVTVSREQAKSQAKTAAVISMLFLSEITSHKNSPSPFSGQMPLWLTIFFPAVGFLILYADMQA